jgi:hypothetical protein
MSTENSKPEWFQMAQADAFEPKSRSKKVLRVMALAAPLFVLGAGLALAQNQSSPSAVVSSAAAVQTTTVAAATPASSAAVAATPASSAAVAAPASSPIKISQAATSIAKPGIKLPSGGGEDDVSSAILTSPNTSSTITKPGIKMPTGGNDEGNDD